MFVEAGANNIKEKLGQVFTSPVISDYMLSLLSLGKDASILDPCFGGGAFLKVLHAASYKNVTGVEIDEQWFHLASKRYKEYSIILGDFLELNSSVKYDGIIMNPPYIRHEKIDNLAKLGVAKKNLFNNPLFKELPKTANLYMFFIVKAIDVLNENGEMVVIFPSSWMSARGGKGFRKIIEERVNITDQIDVYGEVFEGHALVEVSILKMVKTDSRKKTNIVKIKVEKGNLVIDNRQESKIQIALPILFKKYGTVRRGLTTGCNDVFINPPLCSSKYLRTIISSPKDFTGFNTNNAKLDTFLCVDSFKMLNEEVKDYLGSCEEEILANKEPRTLYEKIVKHRCWYKLNIFPCDGIIFSYFVRNDMKFSLNTANVMVRDNFYLIRPINGVDKYLLMALLNNYYTYLQLEQAGKKYGAGLLKIQRYDIEKLRFIDIGQLTKKQIEQLSKYGKKLVTTSDVVIVDEITKLLSDFLNISFAQIKYSYETEKNNRLERV